MAGSCEHGNELSSSTKDGEFVDQPSEYWLFKNSAKGISYKLWGFHDDNASIRGLLRYDAV
jgi:hypothetical protein